MSQSLSQNSIYLELSQKLHPQDFEILKQVLNRYEFDLAPQHGFFNQKDFDEISQKALSELFRKLQKSGFENIDGEDIRNSWQETVGDFQKRYWGYTKYQEKPTNHRAPQSMGLTLTPISEIPKKPSKKVSYKDAFFYIWSVIQSWILIKALILVYGNDLAKDDTVQNRIIFGSIIAFSFGSLFLFAWMRRKKPK